MSRFFRQILSRGLPKTGQAVSYYSRDDGEYQAGWWRGRLNSNNKQRFIVKTVSMAEIVIDNATGLIWPKRYDAAGGYFSGDFDWETAIQRINGFAYAGYNDWRVPNVMELMSIISYTSGDIAHSPIVVLATSYWTATTYKDISTIAYRIIFSDGQVRWSDKSSLLKVFPVRGGL